MRDKLTTLAKIVISLALIAYVFSRVHPDRVAAQLAAANPLLLAAALLFFLVAIAINAVKWQVLLRALEVRVPFTALLRFQFIGFFFNTILPANVGGDFMRGYGLARYTDRTADAAVSVIVDRIVGLTAYMATAAVAAIVAVAVTGHTELQGVEWAALLALLALAGLLASLLSRRLRGLISGLFTWRFLHPMSPAWEKVSGAFNRYRFRYDALLVAFGVALAGIVCTTLVNWLVSQAMGGLMPLMYILLFNPLIALVLILPISIGGLGLSQNAYSLFFGLVHVPEDHTLAVSLIMSLIPILAGLPGGVLWLRIKRGSVDPTSGTLSQA